MTSARANRENDCLPHRINQTSFRLDLQAVAGALVASEVVSLGVPVQRQVLLRALVEKFGGEVSASALTRYLSNELGWTSLPSGPRLSDILRALQSLGGVDLEPTGEHDLIVRILPGGAKLYN